MYGISNRTLVSLAVAASLIPLSALAEAENSSTETEVITVSGYKQDMSQAPASITVIDSTQLENKAYRDITEALQDVPGVFAEDGTGRKGGSSEVSFRGLSSDYTLILVNGKPQGSGQAYYNGYGDGAEFGWLPPISAIERIEVVRGPMSSLYGSDALGGVINVITKRSLDKWIGEVSVETVLHENSTFGSSEQIRYFASGPIVGDNVILTVTGLGYQRDEDEFRYGFRDSEDINNSAKVDWYLGEMQSLSFEAAYATQGEQSSKDKTLQGEDGTPASDDFELKTQRQFYSIGHNISWGELDTASYWQAEIMDMDDGNYTSQYTRHTLNTQTTMPLNFGNLVVGGQYKYQETQHDKDRAYNKSKLDRSEYAFFGELHWEITQSLGLTTGARFVDDENYGSEIVPRAYAVYQLSPQFSLKGGVSQGYRTPDLKEGDSDWVEGGGGGGTDGADIGNSDLQAESSTNYEISLNWQDHKNWSAGITAYQTDFKDAITKNNICYTKPAYGCSYQGTAYQATYQYQNVDEAELKGLESFVSFFTDSFDTTVGYTHTNSEQLTGDNKGYALNNVPETMLNLSLGWKPTEAFSLWGKVKYRSESLITYSSRSDEETELPSYSITDIGVNYAFNQTINAYGGIYNLFDEEIDYDKYDKVLEGRRYTIGLRAKF